jgi:hypothetical protein
MNETTRPLVTCWIMGQMGNQMFQIAATMAYGWDYQTQAIFPLLNRQEDRIAYNRDRIFFRLDASPTPRRFINRFQETKNYRFAKVPFKKDQILYGYFQSWKYFDHHRDQIQSLFAPSQKILDALHDKYADLIALPNTVAVHVRAWCKSLHDTRCQYFLGLDYYRNTFEQFPSDFVFVIFSDRIEWCKKHFPALNRKFVFIEGNDGIDDFFLMTLMKNTIISNSTYSWWAAYMNRHPGKIIFAPRTIFDPRHHPEFPSHDFFLPDWKVAEVNFEQPYPMDIELYPTQSTNG